MHIGKDGEEYISNVTTPKQENVCILFPGQVFCIESVAQIASIQYASNTRRVRGAAGLLMAKVDMPGF